MDWRDFDSGYIFILIGIFIWSTQSLVTKIMVTTIGFFSVYIFSSLFTCITAFACYLVLSRGKIDFHFLRDPKKILLISVFLTVTNLLLFMSFVLLSASNVIILLYMYPIFMSIMSSIIMKKKLTRRETGGLALGFVGIFIFATGGNPFSLHVENLFANVMVLTAALSWAAYLIIQKKYNFEEFSSNGFAFLLSTLYAVPLILLFPSLLPNGLVLPSQSTLLLLLYFSIFTFAIANVVYVKGLKRTKVVNVALLSYLTPFIAVILNYAFLGEQIYWYDIAPILLIFLGYLALNVKRRPKEEPATQLP